jgi:uncharacterized protein with GYD domain
MIMQQYILLMTLDRYGREVMLNDPDNILRVEDSIDMPDTRLLGLYGVLGDCDFVGILECPDNDMAARFSLELGARVGMHITTLPAIPLSRLEGVQYREHPRDEDALRTFTPSDEPAAADSDD